MSLLLQLMSVTDLLFFFFFQPGELVSGDGCSKLCRCLGNYTFECVDNSCDPTEECREVDGVSSCYPKGNDASVSRKYFHFQQLFSSQSCNRSKFHELQYLVQTAYLSESPAKNCMMCSL